MAHTSKNTEETPDKNRPVNNAEESVEDRQKKIMNFLEDYQKDHTYAPSIREIGEHIGVPSTSLVNFYVQKLVDAGYLKRDKGVSRSLRVVQPLEKEAETQPFQKSKRGRKGKYTADRQAKIMEFLEQYQKTHPYSPSIREIGDYIGVPSTSLVDYYIRKLIESGNLERDEHISRSLRVVRPLSPANKNKLKPLSYQSREMLRFPILGRIVAGEPIPVPGSDVAYYDEESFVEVPRKMFADYEKIDNLFALEVSGNSMIDAMINDGDTVIFRQATEAANGDMVAVWLTDNEETTLKYFYDEGDRVRLQPANPTMGPIYVDDKKQVRIMGKVVMVIRHL